jgi:hypothetical protein
MPVFASTSLQFFLLYPSFAAIASLKPDVKKDYLRVVTEH